MQNLHSAWPSHVLNMPKEQVEALAHAIVDAKENVQYCKVLLYPYGSGDLSHLQQSQKKQERESWWWRNTRDLAAYEKTGKFDGVYHVLHGAISPMLGGGA